MKIYCGCSIRNVAFEFDTISVLLGARVPACCQGEVTCSFATLTNAKNFQMTHPRNKTSFLPIIPVILRTVRRFCCFFQYYCPNPKLLYVHFLRKYLISLFTFIIKTQCFQQRPSISGAQSWSKEVYKEEQQRAGWDIQVCCPLLRSRL